MGITLTDVLLFGKAQSDDVDKATLVIYRRNILRWSALGGYLDIIVKGVAPLSLPDAIADSLSYVKAFGGTEQDGTPTPDTPVDIVSNNGALKARHQSGLPTGYTALEYIESSGTQYIDTGYKPSNNTKVLARFSAPTYNTFVFGSRRDTSGINQQRFGLYFASTWNPQYGNSNYPGVDRATVDTVYNTEMSSASFVVDGVTLKDFSPEPFTGEYNMYMFANNTADATTGYGQVKIYSFDIYDNGTLVRNFVPAKNSSNVVGMYDLVSGQFFTNAGTGTFTAGATVSDPVEIYTDGTVETINLHGKNLFDENGIILGYFYEDNGTYTANANTFTSGKILMNAGTTVTFSRGLSANNVYLRIHAFNSNNEWIGLVAKSASTSSMSVTGTTPANTSYIRVCGAKKATPSTEIDHECQVELGSTATTYENYFNGGTATAEMLLKVGDYQDVQEILAGDVTRKVGVKVLDGTEDWSVATTSVLQAGVLPNNVASTTSNTSLCSHLQYTTSSTLAGMPEYSFKNGTTTYPNRMYVKSSTLATDTTTWKQYLSDQYAAGTPVIVIYPLATETTESVTGQTLQVTDGDNTLEITQASLNNLELEAKYQAAVSLTIQEVQDANLDPNVEVTIN